MLIQNCQDSNTLIAELPQEAIFKSKSHDERRNVREAYSCIAIKGRADAERIVTYNTQNGYWTEWPVERTLKSQANSWQIEDQYNYTVRKDKAVSFVMKNIEQNISLQGMNFIEEPMSGLS